MSYRTPEAFLRTADGVGGWAVGPPNGLVTENVGLIFPMIASHFS